MQFDLKLLIINERVTLIFVHKYKMVLFTSVLSQFKILRLSSLAHKLVHSYCAKIKITSSAKLCYNILQNSIEM